MVEDDPLGWFQYRVYDYDGKRSVDNQPMGKLSPLRAGSLASKRDILRAILLINLVYVNANIQMTSGNLGRVIIEDCSRYTLLKRRVI